MSEGEISSTSDSSPTSYQEVEAFLGEHGLTLSTHEQSIFRGLVGNGALTGEELCSFENNPQDGPFMMVVKVTWEDKSKYATLLTQVAGDDSIAMLFEPSGPAYVRVLRCRPLFWERLHRSCTKFLGWIR